MNGQDRTKRQTTNREKDQGLFERGGGGRTEALLAHHRWEHAGDAGTRGATVRTHCGAGGTTLSQVPEEGGEHGQSERTRQAQRTRGKQTPKTRVALLLRPLPDHQVRVDAVDVVGGEGGHGGLLEGRQLAQNVVDAQVRLQF